MGRDLPPSRRAQFELSAACIGLGRGLRSCATDCLVHWTRTSCRLHRIPHRNFKAKLHQNHVFARGHSASEGGDKSATRRTNVGIGTPVGGGTIPVRRGETMGRGFCFWRREGRKRG